MKTFDQTFKQHSNVDCIFLATVAKNLSFTRSQIHCIFSNFVKNELSKINLQI